MSRNQLSRSLKLFYQGLSHLSKGNTKKIYEYLGEKLIERSNSYPLVVESQVGVPRGISSNRSFCITQNRDEYYTESSGSLSDTSIDLAPNQPFESLSFDITGVDNIDAVEIDVTLCRDSDKKVEKISFSNGLYDEELWSVPVSLSFDQPYDEGAIDVTAWEPVEQQSSKRKTGGVTNSPSVTLPSIRPADATNPPIFLISVDTFRYDYLDGFQPVMDELGKHGKIPAEPRTQGFYTTPSHASMFTGVHPGNHGHVSLASGDDQNGPTPIPREMTTIPELLSNHQYKSSAIVSHTRILPNYGYGRGFHRYELEQKSPETWLSEGGNAAEIISKVNRWLEHDLNTGSNQLFYFIHLFDPHPPFHPPLPLENHNNIDLDSIERFLNIDDSSMVARSDDYLDRLEEMDEVSEIIKSHEKEIEYIRQTYRKSLTYTANQIAKLLQSMKEQGIFDESLVIITGDHGYEFGDRGYIGAKTLYDENIRPGMIIKLPNRIGWDVPENVDTIDFLPTIADVIGATPSHVVQGTSWKNSDNGEPRIVEMIHNYYLISVETNGVKAIFTYPPSQSHRPEPDVMDNGPLLEEYYSLERVRQGDYQNIEDEISEAKKARLREIAYNFISENKTEESVDESEQTMHPPQETEEQLKHLGYIQD